MGLRGFLIFLNGGVGADDADFTDSVTSLNHPARSEIRVIRVIRA